MIQQNIFKRMYYYRFVYLIMIPGLLYYIIFKYVPMYGLTLAFKDFNYAKGILGSPWVGLKHFEALMIEPKFWRAFTNTLIISFGKIIFGFPIPIMLAIGLNEIRSSKLKRSLQTIFTFPHFLSWIIISSMFIGLLNNNGAVNNFLGLIGIERQAFLANPSLFRPLLYFTDIWKEAGWTCIIYLAAITGINPELYEAAMIDGANRFHRILYITWPNLKPLAVLLLILSIGKVAQMSFQQVYNLYNPTVYEVGDVIETYVYRITFQGAPNFSFSTAVGFFKAVVNCGLLFASDRIAKSLGQRGLF